LIVIIGTTNKLCVSIIEDTPVMSVEHERNMQRQVNRAGPAACSKPTSTQLTYLLTYTS